MNGQSERENDFFFTWDYDELRVASLDTLKYLITVLPRIKPD